MHLTLHIHAPFLAMTSHKLDRLDENAHVEGVIETT